MSGGPSARPRTARPRLRFRGSPFGGRDVRPPSAAALFFLLALPAHAADVVSPAPGAVAVTIYRDQPINTRVLAALGGGDTHGLGLIFETREVDLPAGRSRLRFEGVADGIVPQSAGVEGLPTPVLERNFDYDLLTPAALIAASVGQTVERVRSNPRTGRETRDAAVIRSGPDGVVLEVGGHDEALRCGGNPERLVFDRPPSGLQARPTLSLVVDSPRAGHYRVRLSYLTVRMDWTADYIARVAPDGRTLALTGWITLANRTATAFADAPTEVVAGHLARVPVDIPRGQSPMADRHCWPAETTHAGWPVASSRLARAVSFAAAAPMAERAMLGEVVVAARKRAIESQLGDYKLYALSEPTTVAARQTKQVLFLDQPAVRFETVYAHTVRAPDDPDPDPKPAQTLLRLRNTAADGLGHPLPEGSVQLRQPQEIAGGRELLIGEPALDRDIPVGEPFELTSGEASEITFADRLVNDTSRAGPRVRQTYAVRAANAKSTAVTVEIRHDRDGEAGLKVTAESTAHGDKAGDPLWRLTIPPGGEQTLTYTIEFTR